MFEIFAHPNLPHEFVLITIHAGELAYVGKNILKTIGQLKSVDIIQPVLHMRVNY